MTLLSPGVESKETTVQATIVRSSTGRAAMVGKFAWGPAYQVAQVVDEPALVSRFGEPNDATADYFFSASNFLSYGNDLRLVRAVARDYAKNASPVAGFLKVDITTAGSNYKVGDKIVVTQAAETIEDEGRVIQVSADGQIQKVFIPSAKIVAHATKINDLGFLSQWEVTMASGGSSGITAAMSITGVETDSGILLTEPEHSAEVIKGDAFQKLVAAHNLPAFAALYPGELGNTFEIEIVSYADWDSTKDLTVYPTGEKRQQTARRSLQYGPQSPDQYAIVVRRNGEMAESVVLSTKPGSKDVYGNSIYMDAYFAKGSSAYMFGTAVGFPEGFTGVLKLGGGLSANDKVTAGDMMLAWDLFADRESQDINLMIAGACAGEGAEFASTVEKYAASIADDRQEVLNHITPPRELIVNVPLQKAIDNLVEWRKGIGGSVDANMNISTTYSEIHGNYKYQYDKYNDVNRWIPLAGDIAGLCARTDSISQPWMSPAGYNRGQILNCIKLAIEPRQAQRDVLYQLGINPVTGFQGGEGFVLFGDKTATTAPSPTDRINVRRLMNMLKKNIGNASKYRLFENNDNFTRTSFALECGQYLSGIKALGGVYDYRVICDTSNNTPAVIDRNEFVSTFWIKPARSINFITLNWVTTDTGADFDELIGRQSAPFNA
ncbi:tail sheath protein [Serratia phage PS2]|uniref:Tail sheath protein n=1 Tax=Serratia phage PS2 TaxID=1481112 RepID=A0A023W640_9CAUD|nr:tail sheath [Serratia phage PS2]AHY25518.1 tail sheath protein [Serratia phage PS2]